MKHTHDKSREEQLAGDVLALVERFHKPAPHEQEHARAPRRFGRLALPVVLEALALASFARHVRARHRHTEPATNDRRGLRHLFVPRHL